MSAMKHLTLEEKLKLMPLWLQLLVKEWNLRIDEHFDMSVETPIKHIDKEGVQMIVHTGEIIITVKAFKNGMTYGNM